MLANYKEKETRKDIIDKKLANSGWKILREGKTIPKDGTFVVEEYPTQSGNADYVLFIDNDIVGIVEAKKSTDPVYSVLAQAQR